VKRTLAIAPAQAAVLTVTALTVHTAGSPAGAATAAPAPWSLDAYGPSASDNVVLKWNEQLLATIRANPPITGPTVTSRALGVLKTERGDWERPGIGADNSRSFSGRSPCRVIGYPKAFTV
jgi:hypothetical protein